MVLGTPMIGKPASKSCWPVVSEPSPPTRINPSIRSRWRISRAFSTVSGATPTLSPAPTLLMKCPLLVVPRIVPPWGMIMAVEWRSRMR